MNALFLGLALVAGAPALKGPAKGDSPPIEGLWELTEWYIDGQSVGFPPGTSTEFLPKGIRMLKQGADQPADERGYKLVPDSKPAAIDYMRPSGGGMSDVFFGLYKVEGDTLTIALADSGNGRPKMLDKGSDGVWTHMKFKRTKK
ncbi:MAG: TIGR03067 domain-containing protein [Gemmataceae bacterium]|nr:TIGR03067 domain-containing protein [Gemmataceae bacterium]